MVKDERAGVDVTGGRVAKSQSRKEGDCTLSLRL